MKYVLLILDWAQFSDIVYLIVMIFASLIIGGLIFVIIHIWDWIRSGLPWGIYGDEVDKNKRVQKKLDQIRDKEWRL